MITSINKIKKYKRKKEEEQQQQQHQKKKKKTWIQHPRDFPLTKKLKQKNVSLLP